MRPLSHAAPLTRKTETLRTMGSDQLHTGCVIDCVPALSNALRPCVWPSQWTLRPLRHADPLTLRTGRRNPTTQAERTSPDTSLQTGLLADLCCCFFHLDLFSTPFTQGWCTCSTFKLNRKMFFAPFHCTEKCSTRTRCLQLNVETPQAIQPSLELLSQS